VTVTEVAKPAALTGSVSRPVGEPGARWRRRIAYGLMIGYAVLMLIPFTWSVITSFKTLPDSVQMSFIPDPFTFQAWEFAWTRMQPPLPVLFANSAFLAVAITVTNVVLGSIAGYAFARLRFPGRELIFLLVLASLMVPDQLRLVPVYLIMNDLGLTRGLGQYVAVILVLGISATSIFLMRQFFISMPRELEEAARIDGAGFFATFRRVMLPLAGPAIAAVTIITFQGTWNSFFWPVVLLARPDHYTLPIGLFFFRTAGGFANDWPPLMAVVVMATIPVVVLYVFFQRYFVEGIASSGVKG
jgi:multiple sugar transport system permease protein